MTQVFGPRGRVAYSCRYCGQNFSTAGLCGSHEDRCPEQPDRWELRCSGCGPEFHVLVDSQSVADRWLAHHHDATGHWPAAAPVNQPKPVR